MSRGPGTRGSSLTTRLRPYVAPAGRGGDGWWASPSSARPLSGATGRAAAVRWRLATRWGRRRRIAELAVIVEQLAVLSNAGCDMATAIEWVVATGNGLVVDDLAVVVSWLREGESPARALRRWAAARGCDAVGRLATTVAGAGLATERAERLHDLADALRRRVHDQSLAALAVGASLVCLAAVVGLVVYLVGAIA